MPDRKIIARQIFDATLASIDIRRSMCSKITFDRHRLSLGDRSVDISGIDSVRVIAIGKAAHPMLAGLLDVLPQALPAEGVVVAPTAAAQRVEGFTYFAAGHPTPDRQSWLAAGAILEKLRSCNKRTLAFFLISGGGSALAERPLDPALDLEDVQAMYRALVTCGAPIEAINCVRKHLSAVKGGRMAVAAGEATKVTLAVTDVPAGRESALASGPTLPDPTTVHDAGQIIAQYKLLERFPVRLVRSIEAGEMPETPKAHCPEFANAHFVLLLGMHDLFHAAHRASESCGYRTRCDNSTDDWPVERAADQLLSQLDDWQNENPGQRVALLADGEVSSPVTGGGIGGRNSAFVLACVEKIAGRKITVLSAGTDGIDGNSPAAGAVADGQSMARAIAQGLDPADAFRQSDAYTFFAALGDAIETGPSNNNLRDLRILLSEP